MIAFNFVRKNVDYYDICYFLAEICIIISLLLVSIYTYYHILNIKEKNIEKKLYMQAKQLLKVTQRCIYEDQWKVIKQEIHMEIEKLFSWIKHEDFNDAYIQKIEKINKKMMVMVCVRNKMNVDNIMNHLIKEGFGMISINVFKNSQNCFSKIMLRVVFEYGGRAHGHL